MSLKSSSPEETSAASIMESSSNLETDKIEKGVKPDESYYKWEIVWQNVIIFMYLHLSAVVGLHMLIWHAKWATVALSIFCTFLTGQGIGAGVHRLWAHKCYKAKLPLRIFLALCNSMAFQNHIFEWSRDHRVHHKFTDTDADPHNSKRGFFFSHMGWLLIKKHKDVRIKGDVIDVSDLEADPVVYYQRKYYGILVAICCFTIPTLLPWYCWNETFWIAYHACLFRYCINLHETWLVNSAAHLYGCKPYDRYIMPRQNRFVSFATFGEGFHNYHHVFPWDYKADEFGFQMLNLTAGSIEFYAKVGWAYDLKTVLPEVIQLRKNRTGEASLDNFEDRLDGEDEELIWGWDDKAMSEEQRQTVKLINKIKYD